MTRTRTRVFVAPMVAAAVAMVASVAQAEPPDTSSVSAWRLTTGIIGVSAGASFISLGALSSVSVIIARGDSGYDAFRRAHSGSSDVCKDAVAENATEIISICNRADTFTTAQLVAYPIGAALVGVGAYLLATSKRTRATARWHLTPEAGPRAGRVGFTYRF